MKYDKEYFIKKFEAIPDEEIGSGSIQMHCPLWHCGVNNPHVYNHTEEADALARLFGAEGTERHWFLAVTRVVDGNSRVTPKERILNKLRSL